MLPAVVVRAANVRPTSRPRRGASPPNLQHHVAADSVGPSVVVPFGLTAHSHLDGSVIVDRGDDADNGSGTVGARREPENGSADSRNDLPAASESLAQRARRSPVRRCVPRHRPILGHKVRRTPVEQHGRQPTETKREAKGLLITGSLVRVQQLEPVSAGLCGVRRFLRIIPHRFRPAFLSVRWSRRTPPAQSLRWADWRAAPVRRRRMP